MPKTPFSNGYRMPAEWEPHEGTWLAWPKNLDTFPAEHMGAVRQAYAKMIQALCAGEKVHLLVDDASEEKEVFSFVDAHRNLVFHRIKSADVWIRDYGPIFVKNSGIAATKWVFNAWGDKYDDLKPDNETGALVARGTGLPLFETRRVLEGGSIDVNGRGALLTTRQCLLNRNRNPGLTARDVEAMLRDYFGATQVIWLENGIEGDDTDGHVDDVARFVSDDTVVCMTEEDVDEANSGPLSEDLEVLERTNLADGSRLNVIRIPMPAPAEGEDGRFPASYANFYIGNAVVLLPTFDDPNDGNALKALERLFPTRRVAGIDCRALVRGLGTIHCVTQQQPAI